MAHFLDFLLEQFNSTKIVEIKEKKTVIYKIVHEGESFEYICSFEDDSLINSELKDKDGNIIINTELYAHIQELVNLTNLKDSWKYEGF